DQAVLLYESVNVSEEPQLRDELLQNQLNVVVCDDCGFSLRIDKQLLYHDPDEGFMIYWIPLEGRTCEEAQQFFNDSVRQINKLLPPEFDAPQIHLVFTRIELVERIFLLEEDLDERLVEYIKYTIYTNNMQKLPPEQKALLFNAQDSTDEALCFVIMNLQSHQLEGMLQYNREAYRVLEETFDRDDHTADLLELFPGPYVSARQQLIDALKRETADSEEHEG
ncbi:MAG: hypothetical protein EOM20_09295, partial [Spartobacteria bacterium]|nr:hypothetical protein [Spartobacteria bacterium]